MNKKNMIDPDAQLYNLLKDDNPAVLGELYHLYFERIFRICRRYISNRETAYDLTLDIIIKAYQKIRSFEGNARFSTWLYSIAQNHCINYIGRQKEGVFETMSPTLIIYDDTISEEEKEEMVQYEMVCSKLDQCIRMLSPSDQRMLTMKYYEASSIKQLQTAFNLSASAVKMRLQRARQRLAHQIQLPAVA